MKIEDMNWDEYIWIWICFDCNEIFSYEGHKVCPHCNSKNVDCLSELEAEEEW